MKLGSRLGQVFQLFVRAWNMASLLAAIQSLNAASVRADNISLRLDSATGSSVLFWYPYAMSCESDCKRLVEKVRRYQAKLGL